MFLILVFGQTFKTRNILPPDTTWTYQSARPAQEDHTNLLVLLGYCLSSLPNHPGWPGNLSPPSGGILIFYVKKTQKSAQKCGFGGQSRQRKYTSKNHKTICFVLPFRAHYEFEPLVGCVGRAWFCTFQRTQRVSLIRRERQTRSENRKGGH